MKNSCFRYGVAVVLFIGMVLFENNMMAQKSMPKIDIELLDGQNLSYDTLKNKKEFEGLLKLYPKTLVYERG